ncbi:MAG: hypothetical protein ABII74_08605 [Elusimicrobiota bacterium]
MTPEEITMEMVIAAGDDLNKILALEPLIITVFESKAKGAAKIASQKKFTEALKLEIAQIAEGQDPESKVYDLQVADIPLLQPETMEIIKVLSPPAAERLSSVPEESVIRKDKSDKKKGEGKGEYIKALIAEAKWTKKEIVDMGVQKFSEKSRKSFSSSISHAKNPKYVKLFGITAEEVDVDGKRVVRFKP